MEDRRTKTKEPRPKTEEPGPKVVLDTNVLIASAYQPRSASRRIVEASLRGELTLIVSPAVEREYELIVQRAVRSEAEIRRVGELLSRAERVEPAETPRVVPEDPDDDKFLAAALAGRAAAIVTNDRHLLELDPYRGIRIVRPVEFVASETGFEP